MKVKRWMSREGCGSDLLVVLVRLRKSAATNPKEIKNLQALPLRQGFNARSQIHMARVKQRPIP
jgi:hypothetical protein